MRGLEKHKGVIYADYAAATPVDKRVLKAMLPYFSQSFYNPSSPYEAAKQVKKVVEAARANVAQWLGAKAAEIIFTAGATESINLAIKGVANSQKNANIVVSQIEHEAVLTAAGLYERRLAPVRPNGVVDLDKLSRLIDDKTILVSVGYANNEIGTIQPLSEIASMIHQIRRLRQLKNNSTPIYLHTDASQAACYLDLHASRLGVDLMTLNGGKMYGPKQSGVLFVKSSLDLEPLIVGGGQEAGLRSGTENVAGIVGLSSALDIAQMQRKESIKKAQILRDNLQREIIQAAPQTIVWGNQKKRLPNLLNLSWSGVDGERLVMQLDEKGIMASTGSACAANKQTASHVLKAIAANNSEVQGSLRLSLGRFTTQQEIKTIVRTLLQLIKVKK